MPLLFPPPENNYQPPPLVQPEEVENLIELAEIIPNPEPEVEIVPLQPPLILAEPQPNAGNQVADETDNSEFISSNTQINELQQDVIFLATRLKRLDKREKSQKSKLNWLCFFTVVLTLTQITIVSLILLIILHYI
jgi:hypothetical protein